MNIVNVPIGDLIEDPSNARTHDARNLDAIKGSLERFGQVEALVVREGTNVVVGGNGRLTAMKALGWETAGVTYHTLTDTQAAALGLALNRTGELAGWDNNRLAMTLESLIDVGDSLEALSKIGFDVEDLEKISVSAHLRGPATEPEPEPTPVEDVSLVELEDRVEVLHGDCLEVLKGFEDGCVDAIVTDPPAGIAFMGKSWDSDKGGRDEWIAWMQSVMAECLRVLKPGGHALVWALPRTSHWTGMAIEGAGFEVRDQIYHLFGTGFPKSLDIGKAIDKTDAADARRERDLGFTAWMRSTGITAKQINKATGSNMGSHYLTDKDQPSVATLDMFAKMASLLPEPPPDILGTMQQRTIESEDFKSRAVVGAHPGDMGGLGSGGGDITAPATDAAKQWDGWGTALKPAAEVWWLARKPLVGTVAENVLAHGTGALNIDGARVGDELRHNPSNFGDGNNAAVVMSAGDESEGRSAIGRWPAHVVHDGDESLPEELQRFFYCAKPSTSERDAGLERNDHPTVKPIALMRWLCRLITPPGGVVLDPFTGSGTTGIAALQEGLNFIGIEQDESHYRKAKARILEGARNERTET